MSITYTHVAFFVAGIAFGFVLLGWLLWRDAQIKRRQQLQQPPFTTPERGR